jgi:tetratricopeptide (TPR) repeat protein
LSIIDYIAENNPTAADKMIHRFETAIGRLERSPFAGKVPDDDELRNRNYRMLIVGKYLVFYEVYRQLGDARRAISFHEQRLSIAREIGDPHGEGQALGNLGLCYKDLSDVSRAIELYEQSRDIAKEIGDRQGEGMKLDHLGIVHAELGDVNCAIEYWEKALQIFREISDVANLARTRFNFAQLLSQQGRPSEALPHVEYAAKVFVQIGHAQYTPKAQKLVDNIRAQL